MTLIVELAGVALLRFSFLRQVRKQFSKYLRRLLTGQLVMLLLLGTRCESSRSPDSVIVI